MRLPAAADRLARAEVMAARERDGATWEQVGGALGVSRQSAPERFRSGRTGCTPVSFRRPLVKRAWVPRARATEERSRRRPVRAGHGPAQPHASSPRRSGAVGRPAGPLRLDEDALDLVAEVVVRPGACGGRLELYVPGGLESQLEFAAPYALRTGGS